MLLLKVYYIDILYFSRYCVESENYSPTVTPNVISICEKSREILENFTSISIYTLKQCVHFLSMITLSKRDMFSNVCLLLKFLYKQKFLYQIENFVENLLYDKRIEFSQNRILLEIDLCLLSYFHHYRHHFNLRHVCLFVVCQPTLNLKISNCYNHITRRILEEQRTHR